jgi:hypothetical protein
VHTVFCMWRSEGKRTLGRTRRGWEGNVKTDIQGVGGEVWARLHSIRVGIGGGRL